VVGPIIFSEAYEVEEDGKQHGVTTIPFQTPVPFAPPAKDIAAIEHGFPFLDGPGRQQRARELALRWYVRGIRADNPTDMFFCFFVAIEVVVTAFAAETGPIPAVEARRKEVENLMANVSQVNKELVGWIKQRTAESSLNQRFHFYSEAAGLDKTTIKEFRDLNVIRNLVAHGDRTVVSLDESRRARVLVGRILKVEFALTGPMAWEGQPSPWGIKLEYLVNIPPVKPSVP
jgi:hypothetical protein